MADKTWKGKTGGGVLGQKGILFLFRLFPLWMMYVVVAVAIVFYLIFAPKGRNEIYNYLRKQQQFSIFKSLVYTYLNHFYFGQVVVDRFAIYSGLRDKFTVEVDGQEFFDELVNNPEAGIMVSAHVGNYELLGYLVAQQKKVINAIIFGGEVSVVQAERTKVMDVNHVNMIPVQEDMSHLFAINNALRAGELVSLTSDRFFSGTKSNRCHFLNGEASFPLGAFHLAEQYGVKMISVFAMKEGPTHFHVHVRPVQIDPTLKIGKNEHVKLLQQQYVDILEDVVKRYPCQWYNFHKFWL